MNKRLSCALLSLVLAATLLFHARTASSMVEPHDAVVVNLTQRRDALRSQLGDLMAQANARRTRLTDIPSLLSDDDVVANASVAALLADPASGARVDDEALLDALVSEWTLKRRQRHRNRLEQAT